MPNVLTMNGDHGELARIDITREAGGISGDYAGGELSSHGGNLYLYIDGREMGSLWITYAEDGTPKITLGQFDPETEGWEERSNVKHIPTECEDEECHEPLAHSPHI